MLSIFWGVLIMKKALQDQQDLQKFLDRADVRSDAAGGFGTGNIGGSGMSGNINMGGRR